MFAKGKIDQKNNEKIDDNIVRTERQDKIFMPSLLPSPQAQTQMPRNPSTRAMTTNPSPHQPKGHPQPAHQRPHTHTTPRASGHLYPTESFQKASDMFPLHRFL